MISTVFFMFLFIIVCAFLMVYESSKSKRVLKRDSLSLKEKRFYLDLYNCLPAEYNLSLQTEAECLAHIIRKDKKNKNEYKYFANNFKSSIIDFLILDNSFQPCCVVVMSEKYNKNKDLYIVLESLDIPIFLYKEVEGNNFSYDFKDLLSFLNRY